MKALLPEQSTNGSHGHSDREKPLLSRLEEKHLQERSSGWRDRLNKSRSRLKDIEKLYTTIEATWPSHSPPTRQESLGFNNNGKLARSLKRNTLVDILF